MNSTIVVYKNGRVRSAAYHRETKATVTEWGAVLVLNNESDFTAVYAPGIWETVSIVDPNEDPHALINIALGGGE